jgi:tetratricopeptide (TPR) repeat protein
MTRAVVMHPFEVRGDAGNADLSVAVSGMLESALDGANGIALHTAEVPGEANGSLTGVIVNAGDQIRIDAELHLPTAAVRRATVSGSRDSLIALTERLSMQLLPGLYRAAGAMDDDLAQRFRRAATMRAYLDGEGALRRGAFDDAHDAFVRVTEQDSTLALGWYRRAVAAEGAHRVTDADRSALIALAGSATMAPRERQLVHAYAAWRAGETMRADSLYRRLVEAAPTDADAWFQFAELTYHGGPLIGRPLDAANDAWRRAVALDSANFPALMHAVRLESRAGNADAVDALLRRAEAMGAGEPFLSEARTIGAFGRGAHAHKWNDDALLDAMPDASVHFVHAIVAGFLEQPARAEAIARRLTRAPRPDGVRVDGQVALAHLALARGAWHEAMAHLDTVSRDNPAAATWWRAYFATLPFVSPTDSALATVERQLRAAPPQNAAAPLYLELAVDTRAASVIQRYDLALLELARPRERAAAGMACDSVAPGVVLELCTDLSRGITAESLRRAGRGVEALATLESLGMRVPYQFAGRSAYFARTRERFVRAQLLERAGRLDEAYQWYASTPHAARLDYLYLAPSHLGRARIRERQHDRSAAAEHYRKVLELWTASDVETSALRREAEAGLARVSH